MVTLASACLVGLLAWLSASDSKLPWLGSRTNIIHHQISSQAKTQNSSEGTNSVIKPGGLQNLHGLFRLAAYAAIAALLWSWSPDAQHPQHQLDNRTHPAEPSFRLNIDTLGASSNSVPQDSDANSAATGEAKAGQGSSSDEANEAAHMAAIQNATLGFEKIFVVNLPERADKRDALSLVSALTDIKLTWTSALRGTSVPDKALPLGVDRKGWMDGGIGSWRSQMNVIRT